MRIDGLTPGSLASVDAVRNGSDVKVVTQNVDGFTLTGAMRTVTVDGAVVRLRPGAPLSFSRTGGKWVQGLREPGAKKVGAEGPIMDALRSRTSGFTVLEVGQAKTNWLTALRCRVSRELVHGAGAWNTGAVIKADRDVSAEEIGAANLMLFGTRDTNLLVARFADNCRSS